MGAGRIRRSRSRAPGRFRPPAGARRGHHGRQRPLGRPPAPAARRRASRRHRCGPRRGGALRPSRHRGADPLRLLGGELEAPAGRGAGADGAPQALPAAGARHADGKRHPPQGDRQRGGARAGRAAGTRRGAGADRRQHRHGLQHRAQLRRPGRDRGGGPPRAPGRRRSGRAGRSAVRRAAVHRRPARSGPADPDQRGDAHQQLPALADRVLGNLGDRHALAGLPRPAPPGGGARLPEARPPLRRIEEEPAVVGRRA